jgi:trehalose 6-phosphate phosphatase
MPSAARIAFFVDFDGTLAPISRWPERVYLGNRVRALLAEISGIGVTVGIISGRRVTDVQTRVGLRGIWYVGSHGYAFQEPSGKVVTSVSERSLARMHIVRRKLASELHGVSGIRLEPKKVTVAVHYRNATPSARSAARKLIRRLLELYPQLHLLSGRKVWELLPDRRTSKWTAIRRILMQERRHCPGRRLVFYLGDDSTDERVFEKLKGISVVVGRHRPTAARYFLRSTAGVREFLERFCEVVR